MRINRSICLLAIAILTPSLLHGEENRAWEISASASTYILPDNTFVNPILAADRNRLHLEARYNYEDLETGSVYAGWNFRTGDAFEFRATPLIGGVFGNSNGIAPGLGLEFSYRNVSFSIDSEYLFSTDEEESSFFYAWSELVYSPSDWIWFGLAGQRTRAYKSDLEVQRGLLVGFGKGNFGITGYLMDPGTDDAFGIVAVEFHY